MAGKRTAFQNSAPAQVVPEGVSKEIAKVEFARRLNQQLVIKGWNQSVLAVEATKLAPPGLKIGRDKISNYIRAKNLPSPLHLKLICEALSCTPDDLIPTRGRREASEVVPSAEIKDMGEGTAWLRINEVVPWALGLQIMALLRGNKEG